MMPNTEAIYSSFNKYSCIVVLGQTVLFLFGNHESSQISQLTPLGLMRIGTLPFAIRTGTCLAMDSHVFIGFGAYTHERTARTCWSRLTSLTFEIC